MTKGVKLREGRHQVGGLEERENGSEYAGSDPAPRLGLGSLLGAVSAWVRKTELAVRVVGTRSDRVTQNSVLVPLLPPHHPFFGDPHSMCRALGSVGLGSVHPGQTSFFSILGTKRWQGLPHHPTSAPVLQEQDQGSEVRALLLILV